MGSGGVSVHFFQSLELEGPITNNQCSAGSKGTGRTSYVLVSGITTLTYGSRWLSHAGMGNVDPFIAVGTLPGAENMGTFGTLFASFALRLSLRTDSFKVDRSPRER